MTMNHKNAANARAKHERQKPPRVKRRERIARLWIAGWKLAQIGEAVDLEPKAVSAIIATMRANGVELGRRDTQGNWL